MVASSTPTYPVCVFVVSKIESTIHWLSLVVSFGSAPIETAICFRQSHERHPDHFCALLSEVYDHSKCSLKKKKKPLRMRHN